MYSLNLTYERYSDSPKILIFMSKWPCYFPLILRFWRSWRRQEPRRLLPVVPRSVLAQQMLPVISVVGPNLTKLQYSCLTCLASYCPAHVKPHYNVPVLKKHQLVSAIIPLQDNTCTKHNKLMEIYCQTDEQLVCFLWIVDEHKGHKTVSASVQIRIKVKAQTVRLYSPFWTSHVSWFGIPKGNVVITYLQKLVILYVSFNQHN